MHPGTNNVTHYLRTTFLFGYYIRNDSYCERWPSRFYSIDSLKGRKTNCQADAAHLTCQCLCLKYGENPERRAEYYHISIRAS